MEEHECRRTLTRHLVGSGIEVGPGHAPLVASGLGLAVRYLDRWEPEANAELFPELEGATFPEPDLILDLDKDGLQPIASESEDFIVCSHVLEHLANPIRALSEFHRVLRPGGLLLILLPDRTKTFDKDRPPTSLDHLVTEFREGVVEIDDHHLKEFLTQTEVGEKALSAIGMDPARRHEIHDLQRKRSIHVHCWTLDEFIPVVTFCTEELGNRWEFVDGLTTEEQGPHAIEFGFVLRRSISDIESADLAKVFSESFRQWVSRRRLQNQERHLAAERASQLGDQVLQLSAETDQARGDLAAARQTIVHLEDELRAVFATKTFRYTRRLRNTYGRIRAARSRRHSAPKGST